jgi:DTW domain-containing protein YfiP
MRETCFTCFWPVQHCLCARIKPFDTATRFVLLMHPKEAKRERNGTGRISRATLRNSELIIGVDFTENERVKALIADPGNLCMVLYPGQTSINVSEDDLAPVLAEKARGRRLVLFLIDGTWQCAKKMMTLSLNIRALPRLSFTATHESIFEIKEQPAPYCLSTLESIHHFLVEADRRGLEGLPGRPQDNLLDVFRHTIQFNIACALDPDKSSYRRGSRLGYSSREERIKRKKGAGRSIILRD